MITIDTYGLCRQSPIYHTHHVNDWCGQYADNKITEINNTAFQTIIDSNKSIIASVKRGRPFKNKELVKIIGETK